MGSTSPPPVGGIVMSWLRNLSHYNHASALRSKFKLWAALILLILGLPGCSQLTNSQKPVIRLYDGQWESLSVNNAIAAFIIEEGYGYPVETVVQTTPVMQANLQQGQIDLVMEIWQQNMGSWYAEQINAGTIVDLGMTYEANPQFFVIPQWLAEQYNIQTVFDMQAHWELFQDPNNPSKGIFYNCIIGWQCAEINTLKLEAYGLKRYFNIVSPGSPAALDTVLERAQLNRQPVFGYAYGPGALIGAYDWHILEEPPFSEACWEKITAAREDASLRPLEAACAYQTLPVEKVVHTSFLAKAPEVVEMLRLMVVGLEPLNETLAWAKANGVQDWEQAALHYLETYPERWSTWVNPAAYEHIQQVLRP